MAALGLAGVATGAGAGGLAGLAWSGSGLPALGAPAAAVAVVVAAGLDALGLVAGGPAPLSVRRQVPTAWGRLLAPATAAALYGARLGVGPLTILNSWCWWAAALLGASTGPAGAAAVGATFAVSRTAAMVVATRGAEDGGAMSTRMAGVRAAGAPVAVAGLAVLASAAVLVGVVTEPLVGGAESAAEGRVGGRSSDSEASSGGTDGRSAPEPLAGLSPTAARADDWEDVTDVLDDVVIGDSLPGFAPADDELGGGRLDLDGAAAAEVDPDAERALLATRGFEGGVARFWRSPGGDVVHVSIYEFADPEQAALYLLDGRDALVARAAQPFAAPEVPGSFGFTQVDRSGDDPFTAHAVAFVRGARHVLVVVGGSGERTPAEAVVLAARQASRLADF